MKRFVFIILVSSLLVAIAFTWKGSIPAASASPDVYQGNLVLNGNNVTTIEGRFDINGTIVVEENATLILRNAAVNFTQSASRQYNITIRNPINGTPRLHAYNSTIRSMNPAYDIVTYIRDNGTATFNNSTITSYIIPSEASTLLIQNLSRIDTQFTYEDSYVEVQNSTVREWHNYGSPKVEVYDSQIHSIVIGSTSINCTITDLKPSFIPHWNFLADCSVIVADGGSAPNVSLTNTAVSSWRLAFYGASNPAIANSILGEVSAITGTSNVNMESTSCDQANLYAATTLRASNSTISLLATYSFANGSISRSSITSIEARGNSTIYATTSLITTVHAYDVSKVWLLNSTYTNLIVHDSAASYIEWFLTVHVLDSMAHDVPSANVTVYYSNSTLAAFASTDANGKATMVLGEKMINATSEYPFGTYTVQARYQAHSNESALDMVGNQQISLTLNFIIPEYPSSLAAMAFIATALLAFAWPCKRRKHANSLT